MGLLDAAAGAITGRSTQQLQRLGILVERDNSDMQNPFAGVNSQPVMFNPATITQVLQAHWTESPNQTSHTQFLNFADWPLDTLDIDLYFDTTEPVGSGASTSGPEDVRKYTSIIIGLTRLKQSLHRPPLCQLAWGDADPDGRPWFVGVATRVTQTFSYFDPKGTPLRAKLSCSFKQWLTSKPSATQEHHSTDVYKSHVVKRGDSLSSIAKEKLHDATLWRPIALANGITDPLDLHPGRTLRIPTVSRR
jgi:nucleoid-associated protein YgaU